MFPCDGPCGRLLALVAAAALATDYRSQARADESGLPRLHVVLYMPVGVEFPSSAETRLTAVADYTERFLVHELENWGYPPARERIFERTNANMLRLLRVHARDGSAGLDPMRIAEQARAVALEHYGLEPHGDLWWIWVYTGSSPPLRDYAGFGNVAEGGAAVVSYVDKPGEIALNSAMADGFNAVFTLKGCVHELGHAFGLFHCGPRQGHEAGMSLMGATIDNYRCLMRNHETRVCLAAASAAALWKHPVFTGTGRNRNKMPHTSVEDFTITNRVGVRGFTISGRLRSDYPAHTVIVADDSPGHEDYWRRAHLSSIGGDGAFQVNVNQPGLATGCLRTLFCFDNGVVTGDGEQHGLAGAAMAHYRCVRGAYEFDPGTAQGKRFSSDRRSNVSSP